VLSAALPEVIQSALEGIVPEDHIFGTQFQYDSIRGEIQSIIRVPAGYGKGAVHKFITQIAARTLLSDDALSVLVPVLEYRRLELNAHSRVF